MRSGQGVIDSMTTCNDPKKPVRAVQSKCRAIASQAPHPPSMGLPLPLKTRPNMSSETGVFKTCNHSTRTIALTDFTMIT